MKTAKCRELWFVKTRTMARAMFYLILVFAEQRLLIINPIECKARSSSFSLGRGFGMIAGMKTAKYYYTPISKS
jgi:hypothetical protein